MPQTNGGWDPHGCMLQITLSFANRRSPEPEQFFRRVVLLGQLRCPKPLPAPSVVCFTTYLVRVCLLPGARYCDALFDWATKVRENTSESGTPNGDHSPRGNDKQESDHHQVRLWLAPAIVRSAAGALVVLGEGMLRCCRAMC